MGLQGIVDSVWCIAYTDSSVLRLSSLSLEARGVKLLTESGDIMCINERKSLTFSTSQY